MHHLPRIIGGISEIRRKGRVTLVVQVYRLHCVEQVGFPVNCSLSEQTRRQVLACVLAGLLVLQSGIAGAQSITPIGEASKAVSYRPPDALNASAFDRFYNLDYDHSIQSFQKVLDRHPDDPFAVNHLITSIMFRELYRMGAMNTGEYANDTFIGQAHRPADPKIKDQIKNLVDRAEKLEEERLKANPNDVDALYARGITRANSRPTPP